MSYRLYIADTLEGQEYFPGARHAADWVLTPVSTVREVQAVAQASAWKAPLKVFTADRDDPQLVLLQRIWEEDEQFRADQYTLFVDAEDGTAVTRAPWASRMVSQEGA